MIVPITNRFRTKPVLIFACAVFLVQQLEHTDVTFSTLTFAFIVISAAACNAGGGLNFPSGAYIFFNALLTAILGLTFKLFLGEPGESNLHDPNTTLTAYCLGMIVMGIAAALSHRLRPKDALLPNIDFETMRYAALGCLLAGGAIQFITFRSGLQDGTIASALHQLNYLPRMALIFGTLYEIKKSHGKSATNWIVWVSGLFMFAFGVIDYSKEGLFVAPVTWLITTILYGFNFRRKTIVILLIFGVFAEVILVPFSQYGRRSRAGTDSSASQAMAARAAIDYLKDPFGTRDLYLDGLAETDYNESPHLYSSLQPFMERLSMISVDDAIIAYTDNAGTFGLSPTIASYTAVIPRFLWKDKPNLNTGNVYAHEIGLLAEDDTTTGISFSPMGDAYHQGTWFAILLVWPPIIFGFFFVTDSLTGSVRDTPYALLPIALVAHAAPEGTMGGPIYLQTYGALLLITVAFLSKNVLARFTRLAMGGDRVRVLLTVNYPLSHRDTKPEPDPPAPTPLL